MNSDIRRTKAQLKLSMPFVGIILIETIVAHILISKWNLIVALFATYSSLYLILLFIAILRSRDHLPISIEGNYLYLKSGYINTSVVKLGDIRSIELSSKSNIPDLMKLAAFKGVENHNIILHFKNPQTITKVFGVQKQYCSIGVFVDDPFRFISYIEKNHK